MTKKKSERDGMKQQNTPSESHKTKQPNNIKTSRSPTSRDEMKRKISNGDARKKRTLERNKATTDNIWGAQIPPEVLTKIFMYVVDQNGSLPFLAR